MHRFTKHSVLTVSVAALMLLVAAGPSTAASASNSISCGGTRVARLTSDTGGSTEHTWTNRSNGAVKKAQWPTGGVYASLGYQNSYWVLVADSISSHSTTCIQ